MKKVKAMALVLAVAMISGVLAGCSKTTTIGTDKFTKICEKLKLEEFELLPYKTDRSCEVSHCLGTNGYAAELVGRVSHDEAVIAKLVKSLGDEFSFGRDNNGISAAGEDQHAWMCGTVVDEIRP